MSQAAGVIDVDGESFAAEVLERSQTTPVLVDFWAPWCAPCRMLGPVLERLAVEARGGFVLAKLNTDDPRNQDLARNYGIRGIPAVKMFKDGAVTGEFVGALPEDELRRWLGELLPSPARDAAVAGLSLEGEGRDDEALVAYEKALAGDPRNAAAHLGLGHIYHRRGNRSEARDHLRRVPARCEQEAEATRLLAALEIEEAAAAYDEPGCRDRLEKSDADLEARYGLGLVLAANGRHALALEEFLEVLRRDRGFRDRAAHKAMLLTFGLVGERSALAEEFRARLANLLY